MRISRRSSFLAAAMMLTCVVSSAGKSGQTTKAGSDLTGTRSGSSSAAVNREAIEDWAALDLDQSGLDPSETTGTVFGRSERPAFASEVVRVQWRPGDPIDLYVVRPRGVEKPPVILFLYDYLSDTDRFRNEAWCTRVVQHGFAAVGFVSALTGERYHGRPMREWFVSDLEEALGTTTHDVQMIINYLARRGDVDATKIGMMGENSGATIAILAAMADPRVKFVDAINPWGDWPDWLKESRVIPEEERAAYLKPEFLQKVQMLDPVKYLPRLSPDRVRIEQVADDPMTPPDVQAKIAASASSSRAIVHYPDVRAQIGVWMTQSWWLRERLQPTGNPLTAAEANQNRRSSEQEGR